MLPSEQSVQKHGIAAAVAELEIEELLDASKYRKVSPVGLELEMPRFTVKNDCMSLSSVRQDCLHQGWQQAASIAAMSIGTLVDLSGGSSVCGPSCACSSGSVISVLSENWGVQCTTAGLALPACSRCSETACCALPALMCGTHGTVLCVCLQHLKQLDIKSSFDRTKADFSKLSTEPMYISDVLQSVSTL